MSEYQHERGRLIPTKKEEVETVKDYFQRIIGEKWDETRWIDDEPIDLLYSLDLENDYMYINSILYKLEDYEELDPYGDVQILNEQPDGSFKFEMRYYNGGTCLSEMIEESLNKL